MEFEFSKKPLSGFIECWGSSLQLYAKSITKVWYLIIPFVLFNDLGQLLSRHMDSYSKQTSIILGVIFMLLYILLYNFFAAATMHRMYCIGKNEAMSLSDSYKLVWRKYPTIVVSWLIVWPLSMIAALFFVIPGVVVIVLMTCSVSLILFDNASILKSISGSAKLVWGKWWYTFFAFFPVILLLTSWMVGSLILVFLINNPMLTGVLGKLTTVMSVFAYPLVFAMLLVLFNDYKLRQQV